MDKKESMNVRAGRKLICWIESQIIERDASLRSA